MHRTDKPHQHAQSLRCDQSPTSARRAKAIVQRARKHFVELNLAGLYEQHAAVELVERKDMFRGIFASDGAEGLRDELEREARSRRRFNRNSWQSALYRALSQNEDFYSGGFEHIDEP